MRRVVAYVPDLMDRSKVAAALAGDQVVFVNDRASLEPAVAAAVTDLVVLDLARPGAVDSLPRLAAAGVRTVGFGSHVDRDLAEAARAAGCGEVYARSAFFARVAEIVAG
jgi:hypothetical protein